MVVPKCSYDFIERINDLKHYVSSELIILFYDLVLLNTLTNDEFYCIY